MDKPSCGLQILGEKGCRTRLKRLRKVIKSLSEENPFQVLREVNLKPNQESEQLECEHTEIDFGCDICMNKLWNLMGLIMIGLILYKVYKDDN